MEKGHTLHRILSIDEGVSLVGKIKVRKKLRKKNKNSKSFVYIFSILLVLFIFLIFMLFDSNNDNKFKIESRYEMFKENKKNDPKEYDTVGWIRVQGTNIDYPVVYIKDDDYGQPVNETSYAWTTLEEGKMEKRIDIASHNILNLGSNPTKKDKMFIYFEELMNFVYYDFAKENQFIQLHIDGKDYVYKIFSVNFLKTFDVNRFAREKYENEDFKEYMEFLSMRNLYDYNVDVNENDKLISLYTCSRFFGSSASYNFSITGRLLRDDEKIELSTIEKTEKYNEILEIMKGGEDDE